MSNIKLDSEYSLDSYKSFLKKWVDGMLLIARNLFKKVEGVKGWEDSAFVKIVEEVNRVIKKINYLMDHIASLEKATASIGIAVSRYCKA